MSQRTPSHSRTKLPSAAAMILTTCLCMTGCRTSEEPDFSELSRMLERQLRQTRSELKATAASEEEKAEIDRALRDLEDSLREIERTMQQLEREAQ